MRHVKIVFFLILPALLWTACSDSGTMGIFKKQSPHEAYGQKLRNAGLDRSAMGIKWLTNADAILSKALTISIPYKETGYFAADKPGGVALKFACVRGKKLHINLVKKPASNFAIYIDLFELPEGGQPKRVAFADTSGVLLDYEIKKDSRYLLRLQPELLQSGEYTLTITAGPSLAFPVSSAGKPRIGSFWGDNRDDGSRKHEGIDIFAPCLTPAIAAANGTVNNVTENELGGKVVFFRPENADYTLYYAHLDQQLVRNGQTLKKGDTIGLVGTTGNARGLSPHLHFGIYASGGAINPLAFVENNQTRLPDIQASLQALNGTVRTNKLLNPIYDAPSTKGIMMLDLPKNAVLKVTGATSSWYRVELPDNTTGFIPTGNVESANTLRAIHLKNEQPLYDTPDSLNAPKKILLAAGTKVNLLGIYKNYYLIENGVETGWIIK